MENDGICSRFLNNHELKYSTNKLELLGVVWASEHFRNYFHEAEVEIVTDQKALLSAPSANHSNKTIHSRLTRWVNRLLTFNYKVSLIPGKYMGFIKFLSRLPPGDALPPSDEKFVAASIDKIQKILSNRDRFNRVNVVSVARPSVAMKIISCIAQSIIHISDQKIILQSAYLLTILI